MESYIYLDHGATTKPDPAVIEQMMPLFQDRYYNPSAAYEQGMEEKKEVEEARKVIAASIGASPDEIYFTSGGSEADNWALVGCARKLKDKGKHMITSKIEHHAILNTCHFLEEEGYEITYLNVDATGRISLEELKKAIRKDTILISIMMANNEVGTVQPIYEIGRIARERGIYFHTDAVAAYGHMGIAVRPMNIDLLSISAHKVHGPKGIGCLYIRRQTEISPLIFGGGQEMGKRAGTENTPGIAGFLKAAQLIQEKGNRTFREQAELKEYTISRVLGEIKGARLNGHRFLRVPNNLNFTFPGVSGPRLLALLNLEGVMVSTGSACNAANAEPSHVLTAMGVSEEAAESSIRMTFGYHTTRKEVEHVINLIKRLVEEERERTKP